MSNEQLDIRLNDLNKTICVNFAVVNQKLDDLCDRFAPIKAASDRIIEEKLSSHD